MGLKMAPHFFWDTKFYSSPSWSYFPVSVFPQTSLTITEKEKKRDKEAVRRRRRKDEEKEDRRRRGRIGGRGASSGSQGLNLSPAL